MTLYFNTLSYRYYIPAHFNLYKMLTILRKKMGFEPSLELLSDLM